jgi:hypothetical protein
MNLRTALYFGLSVTLPLPAVAHNDMVKPHNYSKTVQELKVAAQWSTQAADGKAIVDLMAFYQPSYAEKQGAQWVHSRIQTLVDNTNVVLSNSGVDVVIRLVNAQPITGIDDSLHYNDINPSDRILSPYGANGGYPENNTYVAFGADLALYIRGYDADLNPEDVYGYGEVGGELTTVFDVAYIGQTDGELVLAHEIGHNFNAGHVDDADYTYLPEAHAIECAGRFTVMGPADASGHSFFSDPGKVVDGESCGIEGVANNTSVVAEYAPLAAVRRDAPESVGDVSFSASSYRIEEGDLTYSVGLIRTGNLAESASVQVALFDDTAKEGRDFLTSFERVEFAAGESEAVFTVQLPASAAGKAKMAMRYPYKLTIQGGEAELVLSDTPAVVGDFSFTQSSVSVSESAGKVTLTVVRENGSDGEHAVRVYTANGTRTAGVDYQALDSTLVFADGETSKTVEVTVLDNTTVDSTGSFYVRLDAMGANAVVSEIVVSLTNNDQPQTDDEEGGSGGSTGIFSLIFGVMLLARRLRVGLRV